jgi:inositol oxygenase
MYVQGEPDWMVVVGLLHGLGRVLYELPSTATSNTTAAVATAAAAATTTAAAAVTSDERDCSLSEYAWIVGTPFPSCICCPSYNTDSRDTTDTTCCTGLGKYTEGCGLDTCLLTWTGTYALDFDCTWTGFTKFYQAYSRLIVLTCCCCMS